jgi:hypothetical protein
MVSMTRYLTTDHPRLSAVAILVIIGMAEFVIDLITGAQV